MGKDDDAKVVTEQAQEYQTRESLQNRVASHAMQTMEPTEDGENGSHVGATLPQSTTSQASYLRPTISSSIKKEISLANLNVSGPKERKGSRY